MQRWLNKNGFTDNELEPVKGDGDKIIDDEYNTSNEIDMSSLYIDILANDKKQANSQNRMSNEFSQIIKKEKMKIN